MNNEQDWFKRSFPMSEKGKGEQHPAMHVLDGIVIAIGMGIQAYLKLLYRRFFFVGPATYALYRLSEYIVQQGLHMRALSYIEPDLFTRGVIHWFYQFSYETHLWTVLGCFSTLVFLILGYQAIWARRKFERIFESVGLANHLEVSPALTHREKLKHGRERLTFDSKGVGISRFMAAQDALASAFDCTIESIESGKSPKFVVITLSKAKLPEFVTYDEIEREEALRPNSFYLGMSEKGVEQVSICDLPHALAAGTTGGGKSIFFKQAVLGLLSSSSHLQVYLIDLKGGLEMVDFKEAPNVRIIKSIVEAVAVLRKIKAEMRSRFAFLEAQGLKEIDPKRDKKDRILIAVDEASVLYMRRSKEDRDAVLAAQAREITDDIAKLSRAAAIHLILATQKVAKETIETYVQENISGRMCFKMNTLQGSTVVLGTGEAMALPDIKGRGIWSLGARRILVQVPFVSEENITGRCHTLKAAFESGERLLFGSMIETTSVQKRLPEVESDTAASNTTSAGDTDASIYKVSKYLYENKIATVDQVHRDLFPQLTRRGVAKKLAGLEEEGYVESASYPEIPRQKAFHVTTKAFTRFVDPGGSQMRQELKSEVVLHDLALVDIRHRLEADPRIKSFQTENVLNSQPRSQEDTDLDSFDGIHPDGVFKFATNGETFSMALEYESSEKFSNRYKELFEAYYSRTAISGVLFVCKNEKLLRHVRSIELSQKRSQTAKIYYSDYDSWHQSDAISFTNIEGKTIRLNPVPPQFQVEPERNSEHDAKS